MVINNRRIYKILLALMLVFTLLFPSTSFSGKGVVYAAEPYDRLAAQNIINIYSQYVRDEGLVLKGSFNEVDSYDVYVLKRAGLAPEIWTYNGTNLKESLLSIINSSIANEQSAPENAKHLVWQYLAAQELGEHQLAVQLLDILLERQRDNGDGTFYGGAYGEWTNLPVFDALAKSGVIGQTDIEKSLAYILSLQDGASGRFSDFMTTAQAVRALFALQPYAGELESQVQEAIDKGLAWMRGKIQVDGGFADSYDDVLTDTAEVIVTLDFLGRDPGSWTHDTSGKSPVDFMRVSAQDIFNNGNVDQNSWALEAYLALGADPAGSLGISISPDGAAVPVNGTQQFAALAVLPDGSVSDVTDVAVWTVSDPGLASVDKGLFTRIAAGDVELTAVYNGVSDTVTVGTSGEVLAQVTVRIEGPEYTILPETIMAVPPGMGYADILIAGANANGYTVEYSESEYGKFIYSINNIAGDSYWLVTPYQGEGYRDKDRFVFSGNGSANEGELSLPEPAEVTAGKEFSVKVTWAGSPVEGATVIYYTAEKRTTPSTAGLTDGNGELAFSIAEPGTYYIAAAKKNTAQYPDPDNGLVRTAPQILTVRAAGGAPNHPAGVTVSVKVIGKNGETLFSSRNVTLYADDRHGITPVGALAKTGLSYKYDTIYYIHTIAGQGPQGQSGWMYKVNGISPNVAAIDYKLSPGDNVVWFYSTDSNNTAGGSGKGEMKGSTTVHSQTGDEIIRDCLENNEEILIRLAEREGNTVPISARLIGKLKEQDRMFSIANEGVQIDFTSQALYTEKTANLLNAENSALILGVSALNPSDKYRILNEAGAGEKNGIFDIGGMLYNFTAQYCYTKADGTTVYEDMAAFTEPVKVTVDLSGRNLSEEEMAELCAIRYEQGADGSIYPVKLGGFYDPVSQTYTFYTDKFSYYAVMKVAKLTKIRLGINKLTTYVNDKASYTDVPPVIINDRTLVPLRFVAETLGAAVEWNAEEGTVELRLDGRQLKLVIGQSGPGLDVPAMIKNGRTMVPIRYVAENLGATVRWNGMTQTVEILK